MVRRFSLLVNIEDILGNERLRAAWPFYNAIQTLDAGQGVCIDAISRALGEKPEVLRPIAVDGYTVGLISATVGFFNIGDVSREVKQIHDGGRSRASSTVYQAWAELADDWLANGNGEHHTGGFKGFDERTPEEIILDFDLNDMLTVPLTATEQAHYMTPPVDEIKPQLTKFIKDYAKRVGCTEPQAMRDCMATFMHIADDLGFDFDYVAINAEEVYQEECNDK
jgi:hypothetical protein